MYIVLYMHNIGSIKTHLHLVTDGLELFGQSLNLITYTIAYCHK